MKQLNKIAYNFSVSLILIPFFIILNFLNKKESKVICKREFEIILLETQSLSIKPFNYKRLFSHRSPEKVFYLLKKSIQFALKCNALTYNASMYSKTSIICIT